MPIPKEDVTTVRVSKATSAMLKILQGRSFASGEHVTYDDLIAYMIESQFSSVYRHVKYGEPLARDDGNSEGDD